MKKHVLAIVIILVLFLSGFSLNKKDYKVYHLFFAVSKCSYGERKHVESIAYELKKKLIEIRNININSIHKKPYSKEFTAGDFRFNVSLSFEDHLIIKVYENKREIFRFKQNKTSMVRYIFYDKNSQPYLIHTILTTSPSCTGGKCKWIPPPRFILSPKRNK